MKTLNIYFSLGDQGYPKSKTMLVPIRDDRLRTQAQKNYNKALKKLRVNIEHCYGNYLI